MTDFRTLAAASLLRGIVQKSSGSVPLPSRTPPLTLQIEQLFGRMRGKSTGTNLAIGTARIFAGLAAAEIPAEGGSELFDGGLPVAGLVWSTRTDKDCLFVWRPDRSGRSRSRERMFPVSPAQFIGVAGKRGARRSVPLARALLSRSVQSMAPQGERPYRVNSLDRPSAISLSVSARRQRADSTFTTGSYAPPPMSPSLPRCPRSVPPAGHCVVARHVLQSGTVFWSGAYMAAASLAAAAILVVTASVRAEMCDGGPRLLRTLPGSEFDVGWTGTYHRSQWPRNMALAADFDCDPDQSCTFQGSSQAGSVFGAPWPLSSGGVSMCVTHTFREAVTGTSDCSTGCLDATLSIRSSFFLVVDAAQPCPPCIGDPTPNDGVKGGFCEGGATSGAACDAQGTSDGFEYAGGADPYAGTTSNDCRPSGSSVGELDLDLDPLTTRSVSVTASTNCLSSAFPPGSCFCQGQVQPNMCLPDGICPPSGFCEQNPLDGVCSGQFFRQCRPLSGTEDCEDVFPGAGTCDAIPRRCFGTTISREGTCDPSSPTLASIFCMGATRAGAINAVVGLPGPVALTLPVSFGSGGSSMGTPQPTPVATPTATPVPLDVGAWTNVGLECGAVRAIAIVASAPATVYAGTTAGVFKSIDGGATWQARSTGITDLDVRRLVVDPAVSTTVYAATGSGVFRSTNGGAVWTMPPAGLTASVLGLAVDPNAHATLYAGTANSGVFKSTDGGSSWASVNTIGFAGLPIDVYGVAVDRLSSAVYVTTRGAGVFRTENGGASWAAVNQGLPTLFADELTIDPDSPGTLYLGTRTAAVYKSVDGGGSWVKKSVGLPSSAYIDDIAIDRSTPTTLYASTALGGFYKTLNGGDTWTAVDPGLPDREGVDVISIAVDPTTSDAVYLGANGRGVSKSNDGGTTWNVSNTGLRACPAGNFQRAPGSPGTIYASTGAGIVRSTDDGRSWRSIDAELPEHGGVFVVHPTQPNTSYLASDEGVSRSEDGGATWTLRNQTVFFASITSIAIDVMLDTLYVGTGIKGVMKSPDGGATWTEVSSGLPLVEEGRPWPVRALAVHPTTAGTLFAGSWGISKSEDGGQSWRGVLVGVGPIDTLVIDPSRPNVMYAGAIGGFYASTDSGESWTQAQNGLPAIPGVATMLIDPGTNRLFSGTHWDGMFVTDDAGGRWRPVVPTLPYLGIRSMAFTLDDPAVLLVGTETGIFRSGLAAADEAVRVVVDADESCSTDGEGGDGATPADPIETSVFTPNAGVCAIEERPETGEPRTGYRLFGYAVAIEAPPASTLERLDIVFLIDASLLPPGQMLHSVQLLKDGVPVPPCTGPDPCVVRRLLPDGDVQLVVRTSTASVWSPVVAMLDAYLCYTATATKGAAGMTPSRGHLVADALGTRRFDFTKAGALCLPAARDGVAVTDPATALQATALKAGKVCSDTGAWCKKKQDCMAPVTCDAQLKFARRSGITVLNSLGAMVVDVTKPTRMLLPSVTNASGVPAPDLDTFQCYATKPHAKVCTGDPARVCASDAACGDAGPCFTGLPKDMTVTLDEPMATRGGKIFAVKKPTALCLPAGLEGAPRKVPSVALACYAIAPAKKQPKHAPVTGIPVTSAPLGTLPRDTKKEAEVCVPSAVVVPEDRQ